MAGIYPAGGGKLRIKISPAVSLSGLELMKGSEIRNRRAMAILSSLTMSERELPQVDSEALTEMSTGFGERGMPAGNVSPFGSPRFRRRIDLASLLHPSQGGEYEISFPS